MNEPQIRLGDDDYWIGSTMSKPLIHLLEYFTDCQRRRLDDTSTIYVEFTTCDACKYRYEHKFE